MEQEQHLQFQVLVLLTLVEAVVVLIYLVVQGQQAQVVQAAVVMEVEMD